MKYKKEKMSMFLLDFNERVPTFNQKLDIPLLVDEKDRVLLGNSLRKNFELTEEIECIIIKTDDYMLRPLEELETALIKDNKKHDVKRVVQGLKKYLSSFNEAEALRLFDLPADNNFVTEKNFKKPADYNFDKGKKGKEEDNDAGLFGGA